MLGGAGFCPSTVCWKERRLGMLDDYRRMASQNGSMIAKKPSINSPTSKCFSSHTLLGITNQVPGTLKLTASLHLKMDGKGRRSFPFGALDGPFSGAFTCC